MELKPGYKQTEVGAIPEDWEITTVGDAFEIHNTLRFPISNAVRETMPGPYPYYGPTSIQGYINEYRVEGEYALIGEDGDHFLKWQTQPMTLLVQGKFNVNNHAHLVRGTKNLTSWFYYYFSRRDLTPYLTRQGASRYKLTKKKLAALPCAIPAAVAEQTAVAEALSDADALIESLDQLIAKKRQIKQGAMQELLTGKRRLPGFSGEWQVKRVADFGDVITGGTPRTDNGDFWGEGFPWITPTDISRARDISTSERSVTHAGLATIRVLPANTVLVTCIASIGKNAILKTVGGCNQQINAVVPNCDNCAEFLYYLFELNKPYLQANSGTTATSLISKATFQELVFDVPVFSEQTAIATVLSDMDSELAALECRLAKARQIKQGMMYELLTGRIRLI